MHGSTPRESIAILPEYMVSWEKTPMTVKPRHFSSMLQVEPPQLILETRQDNAPWVLHPDNILYAGKSLIVHIKAALIVNV